MFLPYALTSGGEQVRGTSQLVSILQKCNNQTAVHHWIASVHSESEHFPNVDMQCSKV